MAAVLATLDELTKDDCAVYKQVFKVQEKIMDGLVEISRKYDIPLTITEANGVLIHYLAFRVADGDYIQMEN